jgi:pentatricopeptide repeat protein
MKRAKVRHLVPKATRAQKYVEEASDLFAFSMQGEPLATDETMLKAAEVKARRALLLDPSNYDAAVLLGHILADYDDDPKASEAAILYYDLAMHLEPDHPEPYDGNASVLLWDLKQPAEAEVFARQAIALTSQRQRDIDSIEVTYSTLIAALMEQGKFVDAREAMGEAEHRCPTEWMRELIANTLKELPPES